MIDGIESFYRRIAKSITEAIQEDWVTAKMDAIFYSDGSTYFGEYVSEADGKARDFGTTSDGEREFRSLREEFSQTGQPLWGQACFELRSDGKFSMQFGYNNCDQNGDTNFDEEEELKRFEERRKRLASD